MTPTFDFGSTRQNGVWQVSRGDLATLEASARAAGQSVRRINLAGCTGKRDLLCRFATTFAFPASFGGNWDALADCLGDLAWLPPTAGHTWLIEHAGDLGETCSSDFAVLCEILQRTCANWRARGVPCLVFLDTRPTQGAHPGGPRH